MDKTGQAEDARLAALCNRLGRLWSEQEVDVWDEEVPAEKLVIVKPWVPNTPLHCYDFTTCAFWVQVFGLPRKLHSIRLSYSLLHLIAPEAEVFAFLALGSNHNPLLLTTELNPLRRRKTFTFEAFWLQDKDCHTVIRDAWASSPLPVSSLSCKLQDTSLALTRWSKSKFSNGQKQIHLLWSCIASLVDLEGAQPLHLLTSTHQPQSACGSGSYQCNAYQ